MSNVVGKIRDKPQGTLGGSDSELLYMLSKLVIRPLGRWNGDILLFADTAMVANGWERASSVALPSL